MRRIKFRGKRIDNGEWLYGDLLHHNEQTLIVEQVDFPSEDYDQNVHPETVGQFIEERNGIEFFEGDKVNHPIIGDGVIMYASTGYVIKYENQCIDLHEDWDELTVIGNIHDTTSNEVNR